MSAVLEFEFLQNALIAAFLISIISGIMGSLISVNRMMFLSGAIAHSAYGGVGVALFFGFSILLGAAVFAVFMAVVLSAIMLFQKDKSDTVIGVLWAFGMATGIVFTDLTPGYNTDLMSYLFGSILSISKEDICFMISIDIAVVLFVTVFYRTIVSISFDREFANLKGINTAFFYTLYLVLGALSIVASERVVGLILVIALFSIPSFISGNFAKSLFKMMVYSTVLSIVFILSGLYISYMFDITSGASIILVSSTVFFILLLFSKP